MTTTPLSPMRDDNSGLSAMKFTLVISALLHAGAIAALIYFRGTVVDRPPVYKIEMIGAAGLKRQMGVVAEKQIETDIAPATAPKAAERPPDPPKPAPPKPKTKDKPVPAPQKATPNQVKPKDPGTKTAAKPETKAAPPVAGSGARTGRGTDVTNMVADGIVFPYPVYLNNIIRQVMLNFDPHGSLLVPVLKFLIHKDGSVSDIEIVTRSGSATLDLEARGAVEATGASRAFGPLPSGFPDDVLPVYFTFSPNKSNQGT